MGTRGPKPTPTTILDARGSWRAKTRPAEPRADGLPVCPDWLEEREQTLWHELFGLLVAQRTLAEIDGYSLAMLCREWWRWREATEMATVAEWGTTERKRIVDEGNAAFANIQRLSAKFGLTPADRAGIKAEPEKQAQSKERFFAAG